MRFIRNLLKSKVVRAADLGKPEERGNNLARIVSSSIGLTQMDALLCSELISLICQREKELRKALATRI